MSAEAEQKRLEQEIEVELYDALDALEAYDLITVRQCTARAQSKAVDLWRRNKRESEA